MYSINAKFVFIYVQRICSNGGFEAVLENQFHMSKENLTESGFEPETSGLTYWHSLPTELSSPILAVPQIVNYLCSGWGASQKP